MMRHPLYIHVDERGFESSSSGSYIKIITCSKKSSAFCNTRNNKWICLKNPGYRKKCWKMMIKSIGTWHISRSERPNRSQQRLQPFIAEVVPVGHQCSRPLYCLINVVLEGESDLGTAPQIPTWTALGFSTLAMENPVPIRTPLGISQPARLDYWSVAKLQSCNSKFGTNHVPSHALYHLLPLENCDKLRCPPLIPWLIIILPIKMAIH